MKKPNFKFNSGAISLDSIKRANEQMILSNKVAIQVEAITKAANNAAKVYELAERTGKILVTATHYGKIYQRAISNQEMNDAYRKSLVTLCQEK